MQRIAPLFVVVLTVILLTLNPASVFADFAEIKPIPKEELEKLEKAGVDLFSIKRETGCKSFKYSAGIGSFQKNEFWEGHREYILFNDSNDFMLTEYRAKKFISTSETELAISIAEIKLPSEQNRSYSFSVYDLKERKNLIAENGSIHSDGEPYFIKTEKGIYILSEKYWKSSEEMTVYIYNLHGILEKICFRKISEDFAP